MGSAKVASVGQMLVIMKEDRAIPAPQVPPGSPIGARPRALLASPGGASR